jgi:hypothetical protein
MSGAPKPPVIPEPFANDADPLYITAIPDTTGTAGRASYSLGFPPLTMQPVAGGGKPPFGQDVNGILNALSAHDFYVQAGQLYQFDATVAAAIGGYPKGAMLGSTDGISVWFSLVDANMADPDAGADNSWASSYAYGFTEVNGLTGSPATVTLSRAQSRKFMIILNGTLTANLAVILPPLQQQWLIINNTGGAFNTTVRTAGGSGVIVPAGGFNSPVGVYGDGTNIYPTVPAASLIPASQGADPLTLAERTNTGSLYAVDFVQTSNAIDSTVVNVIADPTGGGTYKRIRFAYFNSLLQLSQMAGQVSAAQVPRAAVVQYAPDILDNSSLTGVPVATTPPSNNRSTRVATTAFVNPAASLTMPGSFKLASGHIVNYGFNTPGAVAFQTPYSSGSSYAVLFGPEASGAVQAWVTAGSRSNAGFTLNNTGGTTFWATVGF